MLVSVFLTLFPFSSGDAEVACSGSADAFLLWFSTGFPPSTGGLAPVGGVNISSSALPASSPNTVGLGDGHQPVGIFPLGSRIQQGAHLGAQTGPEGPSVRRRLLKCGDSGERNRQPMITERLVMCGPRTRSDTKPAIVPQLCAGKVPVPGSSKNTVEVLRRLSTGRRVHRGGGEILGSSAVSGRCKFFGLLARPWLIATTTVHGHRVRFRCKCGAWGPGYRQGGNRVRPIQWCSSQG